MAHRPRHSPGIRIVDAGLEHLISSPKGVSSSKRIHKPQVSRKGVLIREIPAPISPTSK